MKGKTFTFNINTEDFDIVSTPLSSFGSIVDTAVLTITVIGMFVIVLFLVLWTRSRKKEIAVLLAVGRSKAEIVGQFLTENIWIAILSMFASTALSFGLANQIGSFIVSRLGENISKLTVQIATSDMLKVFGIGVILICLAVIVASYTVIRLQPKDILTKWNRRNVIMSILSFSNLSYSYDKKKNIFSNISAEMELGKYMRF